LLVIDHKKGFKKKSIIGTYRLIRKPMTQIHGKFYTESEFNIKKILKSRGEILELGRSCVHKDYRDKPIMQLLWKAINAYIIHYNIKILFGCASFPGTNINKYKKQLSFLYHNYMAPDSIRPKALPGLYKKMNHIDKSQIDNNLIFKSLPPLIKGYLRLGVFVGDGAIIDEQFNTIDVCVVLKTNQIKQKYLKRLEKRKKNKIIFFNRFLKKINK